MNTENHATIETALATIVDPCSIAAGAPISLIEMGLVAGIESKSGTTTITLRLTSPTCWQVGNIIDQIHAKLGALEIGSVRCIVDLNSDWMPELMSARAQARLRKIRPARKL